ncbi:MAG: hypothetical protein ACXU82_05095 [Caulobacteraceae bacterium]
MIDPELDRLSRENDYLKLRCAQLQEANGDLESQLLRLQQQMERLHDRRSSPGLPNPLSGGQ